MFGQRFQDADMGPAAGRPAPQRYPDFIAFHRRLRLSILALADISIEKHYDSILSETGCGHGADAAASLADQQK
jgi:hypothetical protein